MINFKCTKLFVFSILIILLNVTKVLSMEEETEINNNILQFEIGGDSSCTGSITIIATSDTSNLVFFFSTCLDDILVFPAPVYGYKMSFKGGSQSILFIGVLPDNSHMICSGIGSEIRFASKVTTFEGFRVCLDSTYSGLLCFKKVNEGWAYLCGKGKVEYIKDNKIVLLGKDRTLETCIDLLSSDDPVKREGAIKDIEYLMKDEDKQLVMRKIVNLLADIEPGVRRAASQLLGARGGIEFLGLLKTVAKIEKDEITAKYFAEAMSLISGNLFVCDSTASNYTRSELASLYSTGRTYWADSKLKYLHIKKGEDSVQVLTNPVLINILKTGTEAERIASVQLMSVLNCIRDLEIVKNTSKKDPDKIVKKAAKESLKELENNIKNLIKDLKSSDADKRLAAVEILGKAVYKKAKKDLKKLSKKDPDERVRAVASKVLVSWDKSQKK